MSFDSPGYFFFLYGMLCLIWFWRSSPYVLLVGSLIFYASFDFRLIPLLILEAVLAWHGGLRLKEGKPKGELTLYLFIAFLPLLSWKLVGAMQEGLAFPLGLSFFTFHCASYLIDCYRGAWKPEASFGRVLLYVAFFPQLVAGPITRAREVMPQLAAPARPSGEEVRRALWRIYLGLFKKLAIGNVLGAVAQEVFRDAATFHGGMVVLAVVAARYYIFADFSGYTDIAIGSAGLFSVKLPENFLRPFASASITEYWKRWHVTLSAWIRDYVLYPLIATPLATGGLYPLILFTFLLLGIWHGIAWTFAIYGLWHGCMVVLHDATLGARLRLWRFLGLDGNFALRWIFPWGTFLFLVCPPTIFFFSSTPAKALDLFGALINTQGKIFVQSVAWYHMAIAAVSVVFLELWYWIGAKIDCFRKFETMPRSLRWAGIIVASVWLLLAAGLYIERDFLYFHF